MTDVDRTIRQASYMTETEALMWAAESDPWLSSAMGSVFVLDTAPDFDRFVATLERASHTLLRLRERVEDGSGIAPPQWVIDDEFDISDHVRHVKLSGKGGMRELLDLAVQVFQDPFDRNKPLWQFVAVEGPGRKTKSSIRGGVIMKLHHSVSDGIGALRLAEMYLDFERNPKVDDEPVAPVPLGEGPSRGLVEAVVADVDYVVRQQLEMGRRAVAEFVMWGADPDRARSALSKIGGIAKAASGSMTGGFDAGSGSSLWRERSRHRHLEVFDVPLDDLKASSKRLGGSINDLFVAGSVLAAARYHAERHASVHAFNLSFIISTRTDDAAGGNSFAPVPLSIPGAEMSAIETFELVRDTIALKRQAMGSTSDDLMELVSGFVTMLPDSMVSRAGRARSARQDWATSNLRGAPIPIFVAGGEITHMYPVGPLAGTAFNLTAMSYTGTLHFGLHVDPTAVDDPSVLAQHLADAYADLTSA